MARRVPASSTMAVPHGAAGVGSARRRLRAELTACGVPASAVDDALLILSELLSNAGRHARPLYAAAGPSSACVRADWHRAATGELTISVTDGGGPTRPRPATPSITARGGRGLTIITTLADDWGVRDRTSGERELGTGTPRTSTPGTRGPGRAGGRPDGWSGRADGADGDPSGVTVWAVLSPPSESGASGEPNGAASAGGSATALGGAFTGVDLLTELDEPA